MNRYPSIPLPWAALILCLALIGQEALLRWFGGEPSLSEAAWRVLVMTIGVVVCAALIAWALWLQYGKGLEPCPLCIFQRVAVIAVGMVFLLAALHDPRKAGATFYAVLTLVTAGAGALLAARQVWLQSLPKDLVPACGPGLNYMLETLPFSDVVRKVLEGSGECAEKGWVFLGLSIAGWTLVFFVAMIAAAVALEIGRASCRE